MESLAIAARHDARYTALRGHVTSDEDDVLHFQLPAHRREVFLWEVGANTHFQNLTNRPVGPLAPETEFDRTQDIRYSTPVQY